MTMPDDEQPDKIDPPGRQKIWKDEQPADLSHGYASSLQTLFSPRMRQLWKRDGDEMVLRLATEIAAVYKKELGDLFKPLPNRPDVMELRLSYEEMAELRKRAGMYKDQSPPSK